LRKREIERQRRKERRAELRASETWAKVRNGIGEERKPDSERKSVRKGGEGKE